MSEPNQTPPLETPAASTPERAPSRTPGGRSAMADRVAARRESYKPGKLQALDKEEIALGPPRLRELDAEIESELEAAMSGLDQKSLLGDEPAKAQRQP